jgi:hypothetical protein
LLKRVARGDLFGWHGGGEMGFELWRFRVRIGRRVHFGACAILGLEFGRQALLHP